MSFTEFIPNPAFAQELACNPAMIAVLTTITAGAHANAVAAAPVGDPSASVYQHNGRKPGGYKRGLKFKVGLVNYPGIGRTAIGRLYDTDWKAEWIEYGNEHQPPQQILHHAVEGAGAGFTVV